MIAAASYQDIRNNIRHWFSSSNGSRSSSRSRTCSSNCNSSGGK